MNRLESILLYKYLPFNDDSLKIITDGTVKFTKPSEFNDPFDCFPCHNPAGTEIYIASRPDLIEKAAKLRGITTNQLLAEKPEMVSRLKNAKHNGSFGQELSDNVGIFSMTRDPLNLLMWAHYSKDHTGFVVELNIQLETFEPIKHEVQLFEQLIPYEVKYTQDRPIIGYSDDRDTQLNKQFFTKGLMWEYEQEERVVDYVRKSGIHKYERNEILTSVIAGMRMNPTNFSNLKKIILKTNQENNLDIKLYKAEPVNNMFEVYIPSRPDLASDNT